MRINPDHSGPKTNPQTAAPQQDDAQPIILPDFSDTASYALQSDNISDDSIDIPTIVLENSITHAMREKAVIGAAITLPSFSKKAEAAGTVPNFQFIHHPIISDLDRYAENMSYQEIQEKAKKRGSRNDLLMLNNNTLGRRYLRSTFARLIEEAPALLPSSKWFTENGEIDQRQIDLLAEFCWKLATVENIGALEEDLKANPFIRRLKDWKIDDTYEKQVLLFKDRIYGFASEVLRQTQDIPRQYGKEQNNTSRLAKGLIRLGKHIRSKAIEHKIPAIRHAKHIDFSSWEDRTPFPPAHERVEPSQAVSGVTPESLKEGVLTIQKGKPKRHELEDFLNQVLSCPESTIEEAYCKAQYLREVAKVYEKIPALPTLKMALRLINYAISILLEQKADPKNKMLLSCYETRGVVEYQIAELMTPLSQHEGEIKKQRIDESYRDFHHSSSLESDEDNYVRLAQQGARQADANAGVSDLSRAIAADENYAEARLQRFLAKFELTELSWPTSDHKSIQSLTEKRNKVRSPGDHKKRIVEIESSLREFHAFEIAALYKSTRAQGPARLNFDSIRDRLDKELIHHLVDLHVMAMESYRFLGRSDKEGKDTPAEKDRKDQLLVCALLHASRAIDTCENLKSDAAKLRQLNLMIKRALIYKEMGLLNCEIAALREAIEFGNTLTSSYFNPSLHYALGNAYLKKDFFADAKNQFLLIHKAAKPNKLMRKAEGKLDELGKRNNTSINKPKTEETKQILIGFQKENIQQECLQIIRNHFKANSDATPGRTAELLEVFTKKLIQTTTVTEYCHAVLSSVELSDKVIASNLLNLVKLSNLTNIDPKDLDQLKAYFLDAIKVYQEEERTLEDKMIEQLDKVKLEVKKHQAYNDFKKMVTEKLREGERIRPGSATRQKLITLAAQIANEEIDRDSLRKTLGEIIGITISPEITVDPADIAKILEFILDDDVQTHKVHDHILKITGTTIFLSTIQELMKSALIETNQIRDVHVIGANIYIDTDVKLPRINLAIGGQHVEFLWDKSAGDQAKKAITIDLSGKAGEDGAPPPATAAANGNNPQDPGSRGANGNNATGGQPGGDLSISGTVVIADDAILNQIILSGGVGGTGGNGQGGGNGADGIQGTDGGEWMQAVAIYSKGNKTYPYKYAKIHRGGPAIRAGDGGRGGNAGIGGKGGKQGKLLPEEIATRFKSKLISTESQEIHHGNPGEGGQSGVEARDGKDKLWVRNGTWFGPVDLFLPYQNPMEGFQLRWKGKGSRYKQRNWMDGISEEERNRRSQRRRNERGRNAQEQNVDADEKEKHGLNEKAFSSAVEQFLHINSLENRSGAFDELTSALVIAMENEDVLKKQLSIKQKRIQNIENIYQKASQVLQQTQTQQTTQQQHTRISAFSHMPTGITQREGGTSSTAKADELMTDRYKEEIEQQTKNLQKVWEKKARDLTLKISTQKFLYQAIYHLFPKSGSQELRAEKKQWFHSQLTQKVTSAALQNGLKNEVEDYIRKAHDQVDALLAQKLSYKKSKKKILADSSKLKSERRRLKNCYEWIVDHLPELFAYGLIPKEGFDEVCDLEDIYQKCTKLWANRTVGSSQKRESIPTVESITEEEKPSETFQCIKDISSSIPIGLAPQTEMTLTNHVKQLFALKNERGVDISPYVKMLKDIYAKAALPGDLANILVTLAYTNGNFNVCQKTITRLNKANLEAVIQLLAEIQQRVEKSEKTPSDLDYLTDLYLQKKHLLLVKEQCMNAIIQEKGQLSLPYAQARIGAFLDELLLKTNGLYRYQFLMPEVNFLQLAQRVVFSNAWQIANEFNHKSPADQCEATTDSSSKLWGAILFETVKNHVPPQTLEDDDEDHSTLIDGLSKIEEGANDKRNAYLFLLANCELSYAETLKVIQLVEKLPESPIQKNSLGLFSEKAEYLSAKFDFSWQQVLQQAQTYDQLRQKLVQQKAPESEQKRDSETQESIESILYQIADDANLCSESDRAAILERMIAIMTTSCCFGCISNLKTFQREQIAEQAPFKVKESDPNSDIVAYNKAVEEAFNSSVPQEKMEALPDLFIKAFESQVIDSQSLACCLLAIKHLSFNPKQLMTIYTKLEGLDKEIDAALKGRCLATIRALLTHNLSRDLNALLSKREQVKDDLQMKQNDLTTKISGYYSNVQILHLQRQVGKLHLWIKQIDQHFDSETHSDCEGTERKALYDKTWTQFQEFMKHSNTQQGAAHFNEWLRNTYNQLKEKDLVLTEESVSNLIKDLQSTEKEVSTKALNRLESLSWRGLIPYVDNEAKVTIVKLLEGIELSEEVAQKIKLKFHDEMINEECHEIVQKLQKDLEKNEKELSEWLEKTVQWLTDEKRTSAELNEIYPEDGILAQAVDQMTIPPKAPVLVAKASMGEEKLDWYQSLRTNRDNKAFDSMCGKVLPDIRTYLQNFEKRIDAQEVNSTDSLVLKDLQTMIEPLKERKFTKIKRKINELQTKLLDLAEQRDKSKQKIVRALWDEVDAINGYNRANLKHQTDLIPRQIKQDSKDLESALSSCCTLLGEEPFLDFVKNLTQYFKVHRDPIKLQVLTHLFWVMPRLKNPQDIYSVILNQLPDRWALVLLEQHCVESILPSIAKLSSELPHKNISNLPDSEKDEWLKKALNEAQEKSRKCLGAFRDSLKTLVSTPHLRSYHKESLLRLIAERLALKNQSQLEFTVEEFTDLLSNYLDKPCVLNKLNVELSTKDSTIAPLLFRPSFEGLRYGLTLAWIEGMLEPGLSKLSDLDRRKLIDSLFEIETTKKADVLRKVVESLVGGDKTPAVAECVANFAQGSWEIDDQTLSFLKNRTSSGKWYSEIDTYTKTIRDEKRSLKKLVEIMSKESTGINSSFAEILKGNPPQLVKEIESIHACFENVKNYTPDDITAWAARKRGNGFLENIENIKEGIAVVSRANQIITGHALRDTQLLALWLMLRCDGKERRGRILQMFTGEGKSITFACLATLIALSNSPVDIITSSFILAKRDAKNKKPFYKLFSLTVSNNCDPKCEANEEVRKERYFTNGKPVDIIYGEVGAFERDLLLTEFDGLGIIHPSRMTPKVRGTALVDEVDGLFLDNAGMVLYLSHHIDSLRYLERVFAEIWSLANHPSFERSDASDDQAIESIAKFISAKLSSEEMIVPSYTMTQAEFMELKTVINRKLTTWVRSALHAKHLNCDDHYIITDQEIGSKVKKSVIPMDKGTGVEQFSMKWSNGLHQFLQFKHGLEPSPDSLKAVFLSNYFFFKRYGNNLYGLSGTLGSDCEQKYLERLYQVDLGKIPRYKGEKYRHYKAVIAGNKEEWIEAIKHSVNRQLEAKKRASLIICQTVAEVELLQAKLKDDYPSLQVYKSSLEELSFLSEKQETLVRPGDLIIATNLAGRGTDLKTSPELESNGGLHVILSYLPSNIRIQEQAFGRTARCGNEGSGEFIVIDPHRSPINEQCQMRDWSEKQRLESVELKDIKKIKFEHKLLRGFDYRGERIEGFQTLLNHIRDRLKDEPLYYRTAQLHSLKNRWAFWVDHMEDKISLVHTIGKQEVIRSFKEFYAGVLSDFETEEFHLVQEPIELIKLGGEYRRLELWTKAARCYEIAAEDPHYAYAAYYQAACDLICKPSASQEAKQKFSRAAKKAAAAIKPEIAQLQSSIQQITPLAEARRKKYGDADYGTPYKTRSEEKIQIWSIFLSSIDASLGTTITPESLKESSFVADDAEGKKILGGLQEYYKTTRLSKKLEVSKDSILFDKKPFKAPAIFQQVMHQLAGGQNVYKKTLEKLCHQIVTRQSAKKSLVCGGVVYKLSNITHGYKGWPQGYEEDVIFVVAEKINQCLDEVFVSHDAVKGKLKAQFGDHRLLKDLDVNALFDELLKGKIIVEDYPIILEDHYVNKDDLKGKYTSQQEIKKCFSNKFAQLTEKIQGALFTAAVQYEASDSGAVWSFKPNVYLSDLDLPQSPSETAERLWAFLEEQKVIKPPKIKIKKKSESGQNQKPPPKYEDQIKIIKERIESHFKAKITNISGDEKKEEVKNAVNSIFGIIESCFGMIQKLDNKETVAEFSEIIRKYFLDHNKHAPEGLYTFINLGLEVIADLVKKKNPPAWFEVVAVTAMGILQVVAGTLIKAYLPFAGELIGNALISTGMDDVMFAINSAISGDFSWDDYADAKVKSLERSITNSAISCGISFGVNCLQIGSVANTVDVQSMSGVDKTAAAAEALKTAKVTTEAFNITSHVAKEVGRTLINTAISQVASWGLGGIAKAISNSYQKDLKKEVEKAITDSWSQVVAQADQLYNKLSGDSSVTANVKDCMEIALAKVQESSFFEGAIRGSRQAVSGASSLVGNNGWSTFLSYVPDLAQLGVSIAKLSTLIKDSTKHFARELRATTERKTAIAETKSKIKRDDFNKDLEAKKKDYTEKLTEAINNVLNGSVFSPLVSIGTQYIVNKGKESFLALSEQEQLAQSPKNLSDILKAKNDPAKAFYDEALRKWRSAETEVNELSEKQLKETPVNSDVPIEELKKQYGSHLKVYKDSSGHLYVQRPSRTEYAQGVLEGKASSDPEIVALAKVVKRDITIRSSDGTVKTYSMDGKIQTVAAETFGQDSHAIFLNMDSNSGSGIGHVTLAGDTGSSDSAGANGLNCLYDAVIKGTHDERDAAALRSATAAALTSDSDDTMKRMYHDWSLSSDAKHFVGESPMLSDPRSFYYSDAWSERFKKDFRNLKGIVAAIPTLAVERFNDLQRSGLQQMYSCNPGLRPEMMFEYCVDFEREEAYQKVSAALEQTIYERNIWLDKKLRSILDVDRFDFTYDSWRDGTMFAIDTSLLLYGGYKMYSSYQAARFSSYDYRGGMAGNQELLYPSASSMQGFRLRNQLIAEEITEHAFEKHVISRKEFPGYSRETFHNHIEKILNNPIEFSIKPSGHAFYWDEKSQTLIIRNPKQSGAGGTAFRPENGKTHYDKLVK